jgi:hypothetical protein
LLSLSASHIIEERLYLSFTKKKLKKKKKEVKEEEEDEERRRRRFKGVY